MPRLDLACLNLQPRHLILLQSMLAEHVPLAEVWAYGSRVTGGAHECSDLDLVLRHYLDSAIEVPGWCEFKQALQNSTLPMLVDVHLWSRFPRAFHRNIESAYVVVREATASKR